MLEVVCVEGVWIDLVMIVGFVLFLLLLMMMWYEIGGYVVVCVI